jgi:hypothetical protein
MGTPIVKNAQDHTPIEDADASAIPISHLCIRIPDAALETAASLRTRIPKTIATA